MPARLPLTRHTELRPGLGHESLTDGKRFLRVGLTVAGRAKLFAGDFGVQPIRWHGASGENGHLVAGDLDESAVEIVSLGMAPLQQLAARRSRAAR